MFESDEVFLALGGYDINNSNYNNSNYFISVIKNGLKIEIIDLHYIEDFNIAIVWSDTQKRMIIIHLYGLQQIHIYKEK